MSGLAVDMRRWTGESAMDGWRLFREELPKMPMKCVGTGQAGVFADNAYTPPQEAIAEVRFITNSFSAEYGRSAGGVVVAAGRSGSNAFHGSAYDYLRNDKLNANSWANNRTNLARGRQRRNDYGFTLSGPLVLPRIYNGRNKTFFFFNWEQTNDHGVSTPTASVPTARQLGGDFSQTLTTA